jgi:hypothetical protein
MYLIFTLKEIMIKRLARHHPASKIQYWRKNITQKTFARINNQSGKQLTKKIPPS